MNEYKNKLAKSGAQFVLKGIQIHCRNKWLTILMSISGTSTKLTRWPKGGSQQANFYSEGLKAK